MVARYGTNKNIPNMALNETNVITGCLKPSPLKNIYPIAEIVPPRIRRYMTTRIERTKQTMDESTPSIAT